MTENTLVGRRGELNSLTALLDRSGDAQASVALISGDAGIGKTRLTTEFLTLARARGATVLVGQCAELGETLPYLPLADALRKGAADPFFGTAVEKAIASRPVLRRLLPDLDASATDLADVAPGLARQQLFGAVLGMLSELADVQPVVIAFEDLHWADGSTRDLLTFLGRVLQRERILLIGTYRSNDLHRRHPLRPVLAEMARLPTVTGIELGPLSATQLADHLVSLGASRDIAVIEPILERADGNPFYAEELLAVAADGDLPAGLADLLLAHVEQLSETAQDVLRVAAVAGRRADDQLVQRVAGLSDDVYDGAVREIVSRGLLIAGRDSYTFRHALLREAVYGDLLPGERARLHRAFANALAERDADPAELAQHYLAAHDLPGALDSSLKAGMEAERLGAPAEAHQHFDQALSLWDAVSPPEYPELADRVRFSLRSAAAAADAGEIHRATVHLRRLRDLLTEPLLRAEVGERLAYYFADEGCLQLALDVARENVKTMVGVEPPTPLLARTLATAGRVVMSNATLGRVGFPEASTLISRALEAARSVGSTDAEADALVSQALLHYYKGQRERAAELYAVARERARGASDVSVELRAVYNLARHLYDNEANLPEAARIADEGVALATSHGLGWSPFGTDLRFLQYLIAYSRGEWDKAESLAEDFPVRVGTVYQAIVSAYALFIEVGRGLERADERISWLEPLWSSEELVEYIARGLAAERAVWNGDHDLAIVHARGAIAVNQPWDASNIRIAATALWACNSRPDPDLDLADELIATARRAGTDGPGGVDRLGPEGQGWLARAEAEWLAVRGDDTPDAWRAVLTRFDVGYDYEVARSRWRLASCLLEHGERDTAMEEWRLALDTAERLRAKPLRKALTSLGDRAGFLGSDGPDGGPLPALTAREREVLRLVAQGMANRDIAMALFISPKTASVHVSNILAKLGATSRTQAAAIAHRAGLT